MARHSLPAATPCLTVTTAVVTNKDYLFKFRLCCSWKFEGGFMLQCSTNVWTWPVSWVQFICLCILAELFQKIWMMLQNVFHSWLVVSVKSFIFKCWHDTIHNVDTHRFKWLLEMIVLTCDLFACNEFVWKTPACFQCCTDVGESRRLLKGSAGEHSWSL